MDEITVNKFANSACIIPEAITPNGDGKNEALVLDYLDIKYGIEKIEIFNRWGTKVFEKTGGYRDEWHGQNNNGNDLPAAAYYYVVQLKNGDNKTGWVYVIR
jgi:gliding motility-associated-like protein